jgi:DNA-directed RNA polymerase subunit beta'
VGRLIPAGTGLAYHRARKLKETWEADERAALLQAEKEIFTPAAEISAADVNAGEA